MNDLISRQAAIDALKKISFSHWFECGEYLSEDTREIEIINSNKAFEAIEALPSAQPEIIRCKDCKYNATSKKCLNPNSFFLVPADDDYCSYAERREDG